MSKRPKKFTDLLDDVKNCRWPKKGDRLLRDSEDWDRGVDFSGDEISRHVHIWSGYMSAGAALIDTCQEDLHERHFLIYPILFNYRHGIELAMKWVLARYGRYSSAEIGDIEHHNLWQLWKLCKQIVRRQRIWARWVPDLKEALAHLVDDFRWRICGVASAAARWSFV